MLVSCIYPSLIDETAPSTYLNFETVGKTASLFLVTNDCVAWQNVSGHGMRCTPWDSDGNVHRSVIKLPVAFQLNSDDDAALARPAARKLVAMSNNSC